MHDNQSSSGQVISPREWGAIILWTLTGIAATVLGGRAISGEFDASVSVIVPSLATATALVVSLIACRLHTASAFTTAPQRRLMIGLLSLVPVAVIGFSTSLNASPLVLGVSTGLLLIGLVTLVVAEAMRSESQQTRVVPTVTADTTLVKHTEGLPIQPVEWSVDVPSDLTSESAAVDQRITRQRGEDGSETIEAELMACFDIGEKETAIHLPIHPVLGGMPVVECEPLDESEVSVTVSNAQPYGIRLEVKRSERLDECLTVPVGIAVTATANVAGVA